MATSDQDIGIYVIEHIPTGRAYVGGSSQLRRRWTLHQQSLARGDHGNRALQADWSRDGAGAFAFRIVEVGFRNPKELAAAEERLIAKYAERMYNVRARVTNLSEPYGPWPVVAMALGVEPMTIAEYRAAVTRSAPEDT